MSAKDELMEFLFNHPERQTVNFKFTIGPNVTVESACAEMLSALKQVERGEDRTVDASEIDTGADQEAVHPCGVRGGSSGRVLGAGTARTGLRLCRGWCSGSTPDCESGRSGSNPRLGTNKEVTMKEGVLDFR